MPSSLSDREKDGILTRLGRHAARRPGDRRLLSDILLRHPVELGSRSLSVALELGRPVVLAIEEALAEDRGPAGDELARCLETSLPWPTHTLRTVADLVMSRLVAIAPPQASDQGRTGRLVNLALRRIEVGKISEALDLGREAIGLLRDRDGGEADVLHVATALNNLLAALIAAARYEEATGVVASGLEILDAIPVASRRSQHDVQRARIASSGAIARFYTGDVPGAVADSRGAIDVFRNHLEAGATSFRLELSRTMTNLSMYLSFLGAAREGCWISVEAIRIARDAFDANPDAAMPEVAFTLEGLAARALSIGHPRWAVEAEARAIDIYEELAQRSLSSHGRDLARCLSKYAVYRAEAGLAGERVTLTRRAVEIFESLEQIMPGSVDEELALAYSTYAGAVLDAGPDLEAEQADDAITALNNAVIVMQRCHSPGSGLRLAAILVNLAELAGSVGRAEEARVARHHARDVLVRLSRQERASIPGLADQVLGRLKPSD